MKEIETKIILNVEVKDIELVNNLTIITQELSLSMDEFVLYAIEKMLDDIKFIRNLRN